MKPREGQQGSDKLLEPVPRGLILLAPELHQLLIVLVRNQRGSAGAAEINLVLAGILADVGEKAGEKLLALVVQAATEGRLQVLSILGLRFLVLHILIEVGFS